MNAYWINSRGRWDHGILVHALSGDYGTPSFTQHMTPPPTDEGVVAILTHKIDDDKAEQLREYPWVLAIHTSDESHEWNPEVIWGERVKLWMQYPTQEHQGDRNILIGCPVDTQELMPPQLPLKDRRLDWVFSGQVNNSMRYAMADNLHGNGELHISEGFSKGLPRADHLKLLTEARIAPCPSGIVHPDSFRFAEAIEAGCLPIVDCGAWWEWMNVPVKSVNNWSEFPSLLQSYLDDPIALQRDANAIGAWWRIYKRDFARWIYEDCLELNEQSNLHHIFI